MAFPADDDDNLMVKALYVDPELLKGDEVNTGPPATAEDYMRQVALEAKALPDVFVGKN